MSIAFVAAMRSIDPSTKHGCVITKNRKILSIGYNGAPANLRDDAIPLTRPEKYPFMTHAEENAILNSTETDMIGAVAYVTGKPCHRCTRMFLQKYVAEIVYGPIVWCQGADDLAATQTMLDAQMREHPTILRPYIGTEFLDVLKKANTYYEQKVSQN